MADFNQKELLEGLNGFLGFRVEAWREGYAELSVELKDHHMNRQGGVHGGTMTALIDAATGFCGVYEPNRAKRRSNATVSLTVNFVGRPKGNRLICAAWVVKAGRRIYFSSAEVKDGEGNLVATGEVVYAYIDPKG